MTTNIIDMMQPDLVAQQDALTRRQQLVDYLRQQSLQPIDPNQMVQTGAGAPNQAVPISPLQGLAKMIQAYSAGSQQTGITAEQSALGRQRVQGLAKILQNGLPGTQGGQSTPQASNGEPLQGIQTAPDGTPYADTGNQSSPLVQGAPQSQSAPSNDRFGLANLLRGSVADQFLPGAGAAMLAETAPTDLQKNDRYLGITPDQSRTSELAKRLKESNIPPIVNRGFGVGTMADGKYVPDPASLEQALALERGKQGITAPMEEPVTLDLSGGQKAQLSRPEYAAFQQSGKLPDRYSAPTTSSSTQMPSVGNVTPDAGVRDAIANDAKSNGIQNPYINLNGASPGVAKMNANPGLGVPGLSQSQPDQINQNRQNAAGKAVDEQFGKDYLAFTTGGASDAARQLGQLKDVTEQLSNPKANLTGPILGSLPDAVKKFTNPQSIAMQERVAEVVQRSLRAILGAQFTENEGTRLIARAYNPNLSEAENAIRVGRLYTHLDQAFQAKQSASNYFQQNNTLEGWQGKMPSIGDFNVDNARQAGGATGNWDMSAIDAEIARRRGGK